MKVGIIGGKLQGAEATYLARQAGYEVVLIDKNPDVTAAKLASEFLVLDVVKDYQLAAEVLRSVDLIIPANENLQTLQKIGLLCQEINRPFVFDHKAYGISSSKQISNSFFQKHSIPLPGKWPNCSFPLIVKPSHLSGSAGVRKVNTQLELENYIRETQQALEHLVIEQYIEGPSLSLEVIALKGEALTLQITELEFDRDYDCKRVIAGMPVSEEVEIKLREIGCLLAKSLNLTGIIDVEVMVDGVVPNVIEIDARLPSQTPTAVLHSTNINMIELLAEVFIHDRLPKTRSSIPRSVIYEHVRISGDCIEVCGEHILSTAQNLRCLKNLYGFEQIITDYRGQEGQTWVATLISTGATPTEVQNNRQKAITNLMSQHGLKVLRDPFPE